MAHEIQSFIVPVPAGTPKATPQLTNLTLGARIVREVEIRVPPGPRGEMGFQLGSAGIAVLPWNAGQWFVVDDEVLNWELSNYIDSGAWQVFAYNTGLYVHSLYLRFLLDVPQLVSAPASALDSGISFVGTSGGDASGLGTGTGTGVPPVTTPSLPPVTLPPVTLPPVTLPPVTLPPLPPLPPTPPLPPLPPLPGSPGGGGTYAARGMYRALDSATAPPDGVLTAARASGLGGWFGYFAGPRIASWSDQDFKRVKAAGLATLAYCSGWADPQAMKARGQQLGVPICLDVEGSIRDVNDGGPWVQQWLDRSGAGLYGRLDLHAAFAAPFHIVSNYNYGDLNLSWPPDEAKPATPVGWQQQGTHTEFGWSVDSGHYDGPVGSGGQPVILEPMLVHGEDSKVFAQALLKRPDGAVYVSVFDKQAQSWGGFEFVMGGLNPDGSVDCAIVNGAVYVAAELPNGDPAKAYRQAPGQWVVTSPWV